jgi:hypothetical protein
MEVAGGGSTFATRCGRGFFPVSPEDIGLPLNGTIRDPQGLDVLRRPDLLLDAAVTEVKGCCRARSKSECRKPPADSLRLYRCASVVNAALLNL